MISLISFIDMISLISFSGKLQCCTATLFLVNFNVVLLESLELLNECTGLFGYTREEK